jgi:hypothetical protein
MSPCPDSPTAFDELGVCESQPAYVNKNQQLCKVGNDDIATITANDLIAVARPSSPRLSPCLVVREKRTLELDFTEAPKTKSAKQGGSGATLADNSNLAQLSQEFVSRPQEGVTIPTSFVPGTPTRSNRQRSSIEVMTPEDTIKRPSEGGLDRAVEVAIGLYKELWSLYALEAECGPGDEDERDDRASNVCEKWSADNFEAMSRAVIGLLPWVGDLRPPVGSDYDVLSFHGVKPPPRLSWKRHPGDSEHQIVLKQLKEFRSSNTQNRARDALVTLCAALSCRKEKSWVELYESELGDRIEEGDLRRTKSKKMTDLVTTFVSDLVKKEEWCCQFARALVMPESFIRMSFARGVGNPLPASLIVAHRMPLYDVFKKMDDENPIRGDAFTKDWIAQAGRQFAFQELNPEEKEGSSKERQPASSLKPDPRLRDLLRSKKPVLYLDMLASLAPREVSKNHGLGDIVKSELAMLFREAKARGEAVVFVLGSDDPRKLAQKVYLRPPLNDFGLRCGFFRWRESAELPWARETEYEDRSTMMLQMP